MTETRKLISVAQAKIWIAERSVLLANERVSLIESLGRVLAEDVFAPISIPGFAQSSMDGYAFNFDSYCEAGKLELVGEVAAGAANIFQQYAPYIAVRIFTGAPVPEGLDTVLMQEKARIENGFLFVEDSSLVAGRNVRLVGSEIVSGDLALAKSVCMTAAGIGFLASLGLTTVLVVANPNIGLIITGDELTQAGKPLMYGQVYESNTLLLQAALLQARFSKVKMYYAKDDLAILSQVMETAIDENDLVLLTGGVSVGDYDFVIRAANSVGVSTVFHTIKQKPGKPIFFGTTQKNCLVFGLPGNPASVLTCFYEYVLLALQGLTGRQIELESKHLPLMGTYKKTGPFTHFLKGKFDGQGVRLLGGQESFRLGSFSVANCLVVIPSDTEWVETGDLVEVHVLHP
ncbi:MAG: molybdopterin molybdenumtransferase MoeA [Flavobacteriaceae bacterium]|nr:molybdopterin molybdenumtransferase MoeA [Flavobacteriaceae bacterium]